MRRDAKEMIDDLMINSINGNGAIQMDGFMCYPFSLGQEELQRDDSVFWTKLSFDSIHFDARELNVGEYLCTELRNRLNSVVDLRYTHASEYRNACVHIRIRASRSFLSSTHLLPMSYCGGCTRQLSRATYFQLLLASTSLSVTA